MVPYVGMKLKCGRGSERDGHTFPGYVEIVSVDMERNLVGNQYFPEEGRPGYYEAPRLRSIAQFQKWVETGWWVPVIPDYMQLSEGL